MVDELFAQWREFGVKLRPAASEVDLAAIEAVLEASLPAEARAMYARANGMADHGFDRWFTSFWSSERFVAEHEVRNASDKRGAFRDVSFADVMISSWYFWYRVRPDGSVAVFAELAGEELPSFSAFLARYLSDPDSLCLVETNGYG